MIIFHGERVVGCKPPPADDARAAGVSIFLSPRAAKMKIPGDEGAVDGGRIAWVRLRGAFHDILGVVVYVPPRSRAKPPFWDDVFDKLECLLRKIRKKGDCVVLMGDFNGRLARGKPGSKGRVGQFTPHGKADQLGLRLTALMEEFDLFAPQTFFPSTKQACRQLGNATYVMEKRSAAELRRLGIKPQPAAMIDYVLISQRFRSSAEGGRVRWAPTMLRHGLGKYDHGMVEITFRMRITRPAAVVKKKDFTALSDPEVKAKHDAAALEVWMAEDPDGAANAEAARLRTAAGVTSLVPTQVRASTGTAAAPPLLGKSPEELGLVKPVDFPDASRCVSGAPPAAKDAAAAAAAAADGAALAAPPVL